VRLEYQLGARDQTVYAAILDMEKGGNGNVDPELLPLAAYGLEEPWLEEMLYYALVVFGVLYYPMALLMGTIFASGTVAFGYPAAFVSIARTSKDYTFLLILVGAVSLAAHLLSGGLSIALRNHAPWIVATGLSVWARSWLLFYAGLVTSVGVGRYYVRNQSTLGWLDSGSEAPPPVPDANEWKPPLADEPKPAGPTFGPPPGSFPPPRERPAGTPVDATPVGKALAALNSIPRQVEIGIMVAGLVVCLLGVRSFGQHWTFDAACTDILKKSARMQVPLRTEILAALAKQGFAVRDNELQIIVFQTFDKDEFVKSSVTYVNVSSPTADFYHRHEVAGRPMAPVDYTKDMASVWAAPVSRDRMRSYLIFGGAAIALLFAAKAFLLSRD
jgi:hypothetical protein